MLEGQERQDSLNHFNSLDNDIEDNYKAEEESDIAFGNINPSILELEDNYRAKMKYLSSKKKKYKQESIIKIWTFSIIFFILVIIGSVILIISLLKEKDDEKNEKKENCCKHCICKNDDIKCGDNFLKINNRCYENNCSFIAFYHKDSSDKDSIQFINDIFKDNIEINIIENEEIIKEDSFESESHISICANLISNIA